MFSFGVSIIVVVVTTCVAGMMSGLTLALFSLEENYLRVMASSGTPSQQKYAERLISIVEQPHWLLVTLLLCNAGAVELMPLALDALVSPIIAVALSVILVLVFGEIIPQAVFVRYALTVGGIVAPFLKVLMYLTAIISYPIGKLLDVLVGHKHGVLYRRFELREFIRLQVQEGGGNSAPQSGVNERRSFRDGSDSRGGSTSAVDVADRDRSTSVTSATSPHGGLTRPELRIMIGALSLSDSTAESITKVPVERVFSISMDAVMNKELVNKIFASGFSRIPVYDGKKSNLTHYLIAKTLILLIYKDESEAPVVKDLSLRRPIFCVASTPLSDLYVKFQSGESHIAVVRDESGVTIGITTVEDLMERLHQTSFLDETDVESSLPAQSIMRHWRRSRAIAPPSMNSFGPVSAGGGGKKSRPGTITIPRIGSLQGFAAAGSPAVASSATGGSPLRQSFMESYGESFRNEPQRRTADPAPRSEQRQKGGYGTHLS